MFELMWYDEAMAVGTVVGDSAVLEQLAGTVEGARKCALMLDPSQLSMCPDVEVEALLRMHAQLESVTAAIGHLIVRDADVRGLAQADGKKSTTSWLGKRIKLPPGEGKARVKTAEM